MTSFNSQEDFLRALEANPQWKEAVRALILGEELLRLPSQFRAFVGRVSSFIDQTEAFIGEQRQFNEGFTRRLGRIEANISNFRGEYARNALHRQAMGIAMDMGFDYVRTVPYEELARMAQRAAGRIPTGELRSFRNADLIMEATDESDTIYIAVESSYTADQRDTDRAQRNVRFLEEFTGRPARAAIASVRNDRFADSRVESGAVYWYQLEDRNPVPE